MGRLPQSSWGVFSTPLSLRQKQFPNGFHLNNLHIMNITSSTSEIVFFSVCCQFCRLLNSHNWRTFRRNFHNCLRKHKRLLQKSSEGTLLNKQILFTIDLFRISEFCLCDVSLWGFWDLTQSSVVGGHRNFGGTCQLRQRNDGNHLQDCTVSQPGRLQPKLSPCKNLKFYISELVAHVIYRR